MASSSLTLFGSFIPHPLYLGVVAILGCQLDYIWNELQSRIRGLTCDPDLGAGRYKLLIWILAWRSWGIVAMYPRRQGGLWVQGHLGQSKSQIQVWWYTPLIRATPSAGDLHKDIGRRKNLSLLRLLALWDWGTGRSLDFQVLLTIIGELDYRL